MSWRSKRSAAASFVLAAIALCVPASAGAAEFEKYAVESVSAALSTTQAGAHADVTINFELSQKEGAPYGLTRDLAIDIPPGVIGNPQEIPRCSVSELGSEPKESECPISSQVGVSELTLGGDISGTFIEPVYNMEPPKDSDIVARLGMLAALYPVLINVRVDPVDYGLVATMEGAPAAAGLVAASTTLWGVPAAKSHDALRLTPEEAVKNEMPTGGRSAGLPEAPFMSNPTSCGTPRQISVTATSYQLPDAPSTKSAPFPAITGCGALNFEPTFTAVPTNPEAAAPTGLDAELTIPQDETPQGLATSALKSAAVTLPEGMTINPAAADGLAACSSLQVGFENTSPPQCPAAAKIGSVEIDVPALERVLQGAVYQRTPEPGHLFRFWLVTDELGVRLKLPAEIEANPLTGQLRTVFSGIPSLGGNPQVPVESLKFHVFGGPRAPLATPAACGTYQTRYELAPWSERPATVGQTPMQIVGGCGKGGFSPRLSAGMLGLRAGSFSPFVMTLTRQDGEANPQSLSVTLPQGLLAKLGGVPLCSDPDAATGMCPTSSQVGSIAAATGVGGAPLWIPQPGKAPTAVYLAGPYKGAPYSIVAKVPAQAGPFDLGTVVNRAGIYVDPETAIATIKTDPLPQILEGVPVLYRSIQVAVDRPNFTLNPTDCSAKEVKASVLASNGATATPTAPYKATNCAKLAYSPKLKLRFKGSTKRTGNPAVKAVLTQPANQANTAGATVILPPSQFIDQAHINNPCTRVQFNAGACPKGSILGTAEAITPLLDQPLKGPVYFRSNGGERELPDLVADLHGPIHVTLVGWVDSVQKKGTEISRVRTRFANVPDAPVTKFTMNLFGGKRGLIENSRPLCKVKRVAKVRFAGQNGRQKNQNLVIATGCKKHR
ncbi:MAG: hypothetical protein M3335_02345 [Actinomycetota bacterium]|nr:hypothetical protein [Actinomycetota bacterium]